MIHGKLKVPRPAVSANTDINRLPGVYSHRLSTRKR
jgi:hypothetical protein